MDDRIHESSENQPQSVPRANLFFLLQTLAIHAQPRTNERKSCVESFITDEQIQAYVGRNGTV